MVYEMKTVLFITKPLIVEPLGIMYLSSALKKHNHRVLLTNNPNDAIDIKPDYICYSVMTGDQNYYLNINSELKKKLKFKSVFGGPHPSFFPMEMIKHPDVDHVCKGEGEEYIVNLVNENKPNDCKLLDVDTLEHPDRTLFNSEIRYFLSSRGCPYNCTYCYNQKWFTLHTNDTGYSRIRLRNPKDLVDEIKNTSTEFVYFQDDNFGVDLEWLKEFKELYPKIPFHCHLRPNLVTDERVRLIKECGCYSIRAAIETANNTLRNVVLKRNITYSQIKDSTDIFKKYNVKFMLQNMIGIPNGSIQDDMDTLKMNVDLQPDYAWVSILQPYPGTELGNYCQSNGFYTGDYSDISSNFKDNSVLNFTDKYKEQIKVLQKIFALYVEAKMIPNINDLKLDKLSELVYSAMRRIGDRKLYGNIVDKWRD